MSRIDEDGTQHLDGAVDLVRVGAVGEHLSTFLLLYHYASGIFPIGQQQNRHLWWSPEPRAVLFSSKVHASRSLLKTIRQNKYLVTADTAFADVVTLCRTLRSTEEGPGTWITDEYYNVFVTLHALGHGHSIEVWEGDQLVGGLFGIAIGRMFYGCSMFHLRPNTSKIALIRLAQKLNDWGFPLIDCQMHSPHLRTMGARFIPRTDFHKIVRELVRGPRFIGPWTDEFTRGSLRV